MLRLAASRGGGPETRSGTVQSLKCCPCQQKRAARLPSAAPGSIKGGGPETRSGTVQSLKCCPCQQKRAARLPSAGPRNALGHRLPLPAETSREAPKCCAWQHEGGGAPKRARWQHQGRGGGPETRCCTVQSLKCCPASRNQPRGSQCCAWQHQEGGPETRSGTVQSLKCCPCQQKRAARLPSAAPGTVQSLASRRGGQTKCCAWQHQGRGGPRNALGYRPEPAPASGSQVLRLAASRGGPRNALGYRPEPEVLPLPAETSREAAKCCAWQHEEGGPETRSGTVQSLKCCPCQQKRAARLPSAASRGPRNALGHRPEPEVLPLPAETSREAPKCETTRSGTVSERVCVYCVSV